MDVIEKFLNEVSWKFDKGYPDITNEQDMKILNELAKGYIGEQEEEKSLKDKLIDIIKGSDLSDKELESYIKSVSNRGFKSKLTTRLTNKGYTADRFKAKDKALDKIFKDLEDADLNTFFNYVENPKNLSDLPIGGKFHEETGLDRELIKALIDIEPGADQTGSSIGKAELFLSLAFGDVGNTFDIKDLETGEIKKAKGDNQWKGEGNLEVKGTGGRLGQQSGRGIDAIPMFKTLGKKLLSDENYEELVTYSPSVSWAISKTLAKLYELAKSEGIPENEIKKEMVDTLDDAYWGQNLAQNYFKTESDFTDNERTTKQLLKLNATSYSLIKGVDAIMFVDTKTGDNRYVIVKRDELDDAIDSKKFWTTTKSPTGFQWSNVNPNLSVGAV
jgi:hypothetical protein